MSNINDIIDQSSDRIFQKRDWKELKTIIKRSKSDDKVDERDQLDAVPYDDKQKDK